jgi:hypothetical protein
LEKRFPQLVASSTPTGRLINPIDGKPDFIAVARVRDTPLVLAVTREEMVALRPWRDEAMRLAARSIVVALLGLGGSGCCGASYVALKRGKARCARVKSAMHWRWKARTRGIGTGI